MKTWFDKNLYLIIYSVLAIILSVVIIGCIFAPSLFYDQWIWKYYWGPLVADANPNASTAIHNGIVATEGYTLISEITYGLLLIISLFGIYNLLKKLKIIIDWRFCLALMPYIIYGPVSRVLEDADYFSIPFVYWFISPLIYLQIAIFAIFFVIFGSIIERYSKNQKNYKYSLSITIIVLLVVNIFVTLIWMYGAKYGYSNFEPFIFYTISCFSFVPIFYNFIKNKYISVNSMVFSGGLLFLLPGIYLIGKWIFIEQWSTSVNDSRFDIFLLIVVLVSIVTVVVYLISKKFQKNDNILAFKKPLNLAMIVGHMVDGFTSYISIYDPLNMGLPIYVEKHPASNLLMEIWPPLFPIVKFFLIVFVIYVFDILYREELKNYKTFVNLIKIGILILGFSPGARDLLRVTMGV